ncbi:hypothetical protein Hanom_Chr15g01352591 [Helianthus anomalus]
MLVANFGRNCLILRGTWGKVRREKTKWLELEIRSLKKNYY